MPQLSLHTPIGDLTVSEQDGKIVSLDWGWGRDQAPTELLAQASAQLHAYFDGLRRHFDLPLQPPGTAYQRRVWRALCDIPPGETRSYDQVARLAGGVARSVGQASRCNPIPILIPCHRVVAASGLGGYTGEGGVTTKAWLLAREQAMAAPAAGAFTGQSRHLRGAGLQGRET